MKEAMPPQKIIEILMSGGVGIFPTDTLYGIVGSALSKSTVGRIYTLRKRNPQKPMIVLISSITDLKTFGVHPSARIKKLLKQYWPGKVSVILPISRRRKFLTKFSYLHRGTGTLAFRLPAAPISNGERFDIQKFLKKTGPLVAPSANFEGEPPAKTIRAAKKYFGDKVDFYSDAGTLRSKPSTLVAIKNGKMIVLRKGAVSIN